MSFFGDLFSAFSSDPAKQAAQDQIAALRAGQSQGIGALNTGQLQATGAINSGDNALTSGQSSADALYGRAYQPFSALFNKSQPGYDAYADATGANGAAGLQRANANFTQSTGYSGGLNTGIDQVMRNQAALGGLGGGNTLADLTKFASDYDSQKYNNYVQNLAPWLGAANSAAAGGAGVLGANAGTDASIANSRAGNFGTLAGIDTNLAGAQAGIDTSTAQQAGQAQANADLAPYQTSSNFWNALLGGANLALKATGVGGFSGGK